MKKEMSAIKQLRLNSILDMATSLLVEKPNASMAEIAEGIGIGIATLHRYVESREQLMVHLGFRAIDVVTETLSQIPIKEENCESYIPELIEALIPLGDKIYFLDHDTSLHYNKEIEEADKKLREPILHVIELLQQKGYFQQGVSKEWIINVLYSLLFLTWQQVQEGNLAKNSAAALVVDTFFNGFKVNKS
ncbi:TetR/AcrR family transcriptional regulator [Paenibacillus sp. Leaf72]|uniref:TetR/AcrR family transcriptional regulator n=1 Tax=Paenibacillus sp. Leaf72 TaxID=1736234 RepID=UPI0007008290|nr:helix-turn-helix domain-containing protein [Paenibacillus sp. Leaf72]KQO04688.1 TetR family transcriptional regulator [Paenibacillus sp. Leaf72]